MTLVVKGVVREGGKFFKIIEKTVYEPIAFNTSVVSRIDGDGYPVQVSARTFNGGARKVEERLPATPLQWLVWKLFKVYP